MKFENLLSKKGEKKKKPSSGKRFVSKAGVLLGGLALFANTAAEAAELPDNDKDNDKSRTEEQINTNINKLPPKTIEFSVAQSQMEERNNHDLDLEGGPDPEKPIEQSYQEINEYIQADNDISGIYIYDAAGNSISMSGIYPDMETAQQKSPEWFAGDNKVVPSYENGAMLRPMGDADTYFDEEGNDIFVEREDGSFDLDKAIKTGAPFVYFKTIPFNEKGEVTENINEGITMITEVEGDGLNISISQNGEMKYLLTYDIDDNKESWRPGYPDSKQDGARYMSIKEARKLVDDIFNAIASGESLNDLLSDTDKYGVFKVTDINNPDYDEETKQHIEESSAKYIGEIANSVEDYKKHKQEGVNSYKGKSSNEAREAFEKL